MTPGAAEVNDLCLRALIRYFRPETGPLDVARPKLTSDDIQSLQIYWALSQTIADLAEFIVTRPRVLAETLVPEMTLSYGGITGSIAARETLLFQQRTNDPCAILVEEVNTSYLSPLNLLVTWVLNNALRTLLVIARHDAIALLPAIQSRTILLERALRTSPLRELSLNPAVRNRPDSFALRSAARSRQPIYAHALRAFQFLQAVESLEPDALRHLFSTTLLSDLEEWQRFELAACIKTSEALAARLGIPLTLDLSLSYGAPFARVGDYSVIWQKPIRPRRDSDLAPLELQLKEMALSLGVGSGSARSDITVLKNNTVIALVECKWYGSVESYNSATWDACSQLLRYARDLCPGDDAGADALLAKSLIVVRSSPPDATQYRRSGSDGLVNCAHLADLDSAFMTNWVASLGV